MKYLAFLILIVSSQLFATDCPYYWGPDSKQINFNLPVDKITLSEASRLVSTESFRSDLIDSNNDCGNITWFQASILNAQLEMYELENDPKYLNDFITLADKIYSQNDIFTNKYDALRKRVVFGWSSTKYTKYKQRHVMGVDSAIIAEPYSKFVNIVLKNNLRKYKSKAKLYLKIATRALSEIEEDWSAEVGFYKFKKRSHKHLTIYPYNQGLAIGSVYIELHNAYSLLGKKGLSSFYLDRSLTIGEYFKKSLIYDIGFDRYLWRYAPGSYYEDSSHASIDLNFVIKAYENNILFDLSDMKKFANTIYKTFNLNGFARYLDGKDLARYTSWHSLTCLRLSSIAKYSNKESLIKDKCLSNVSKIITNKNILKDMPYQFYTQLVHGLPMLLSAKK